MGVSTDAILVFGIPINAEDEPWYDEDESEEDEADEVFSVYTSRADRWLLSRLGQDALCGTDAGADFLNDEKRCPLTLLTHCSDNYVMYVLAARGSEFRAWRGDPKDIPSNLPTPPDDVVRLLRNFNMGEPRWVLCSWWG